MRAAMAFLLCVLGVAQGCGERTSSTSSGTEGRDASVEGVQDDGAPAGVEPVRAGSRYKLRSPAEVLAEARDVPEPVERLEPERAWREAVEQALAAAGLEGRPAASAAVLDGGTLEIVDLPGAARDAPWARIERLVGGDQGAFRERAALYVTPVDHPVVRVEAVALEGLEAFRSTLDDPDHPTAAWLRGGVFVRVGARDADAVRTQAARLHAALLEAGGYGAEAAAAPRAAKDLGPVIEPEEITGDPVKGPSGPRVEGVSRSPREWPAELRRYGGAIQGALEWLAAHQSPDGRWEAAGFGQWCNGKQSEGTPPDGRGDAAFDPGVTGLALLAFLNAGYTGRGKHPYKPTVSEGLRYLRSVQDREGCFGPRSKPKFIYNHGAASLAVLNAYGLTGSPVLKGPAARAVEFSSLARNPYFAWRYGVKPGDNDTSVSGWMFLSVHRAVAINEEFDERTGERPLSVDPGAFDGMRTWLGKMTDPDYGRVGYLQRGAGSARPEELVDEFPNEASEAMTAVGIVARVFMGEDPEESDLIQKGASLIDRLPPRWSESRGTIDMIYWYYGTLAMWQLGGERWTRWRTALDKAVLPAQRKDGDPCGSRGSWDPVGPWGRDGGRVYSTALMALTLEVPATYERAFGDD